MFNSIEVIGAIQNIMAGLEFGLGFWIVNRVMGRIFG